jgi:hypothetical protein
MLLICIRIVLVRISAGTPTTLTVMVLLSSSKQMPRFASQRRPRPFEFIIHCSTLHCIVWATDRVVKQTININNVINVNVVNFSVHLRNLRPFPQQQVIWSGVVSCRINSKDRVLEKLIVAHLDKKVFPFYGPRNSFLCSEKPSLRFLSQMNPVLILIAYFFKLHFNIIIPYTARPTNLSPPSKVFNKNCIYISHHFYAFYMSELYHHSQWRICLDLRFSQWCLEMTPSSLVKVYRRFGGTHCLHLQGRSKFLRNVGEIYQTTRRYIPDNIDV